MKPLLQHLVEITGHRDHARLEISVISALHQLGEVKEIRALEVVSIGEETHVRPKAWIQDGKLHSIEESEHADLPRLPLAAYPALGECIQKHLSNLETQGEAGETELWLPVWLHEKVVACLELRNDKPLSQDMLNVIHGIFHVYRNYQSLLDYSERDALTGLFNRKTFDAEFARPGATGSAGTATPADAPQHWLAVVDIDHFKQVNDRFGHLYGDEVLILMANLLRSSFRAQDRIFRFGGEEFVILLRSATLETARQIFNRFRASVESHAFPQVGQVTVSLGFVSTQRGTAVEILGHADQALYYAKEHGRNQVCHYDELVNSGELATQTVVAEDVELF
ncbi:GGDEF domain-containing protein [Curvibacter sp. HBC28]|uniref:diguanylate cyclase n=1 Tax=Curvibacter microcysteis TaxID=3026419 RepID=A0ABT5MEP2_9BURK|nr:GGDEF domain-containing protein [Curvibacter sp. HBC28]MDD0815049.1 GGDEF domain-containing protein [Curvibacter sp. HBC28]